MLRLYEDRSTTEIRLSARRADRLLITADGGGSNGSRLRLWKTQLAHLATETGLSITVCHLPPGTSKWNKIEHRMFSAITMNWRGRPLQTHEVVVETIAATTTKTGLRIQAALDTSTYQRGIKITDKEMKAFEAAHLPPGTSKWNRIEHRLFSAITMNWRGRPLQTHEVVVETIAATTTTTGLTVSATLDTNTYQHGIKITDREMKVFEARHLHRHDFHGN